MRKYDVFISYRRVGGKEKARPLKSELEKRGYKVFLDFDDLKDSVFDKRIMDAIDEAPIFLIILSEHSLDRCKNEDDWVRKEIEYANKKNKHFVPVNPDKEFKDFPEDIPNSVKECIGQHQFSSIDFEQLFQLSIDKMVEDRIQPIIARLRETSKKQTGALVRIETDLDCRVLRFKEELAYYNGNNDKCVGPEGWHCVKYEYDENNRLLEKSYWNVDDKPVDIILDNKKIACRIKYSYDRGFDKSEWHYMADGDSICISGYISKLLDNGDYFEGYVKNEIPNGYGKYVSVRGWNYEGDWKDNYFDGKGKYTYENVYYYIGDFERNNFHGYGSVYSINDSLCYSGKFKDDEYIGQVLISIEDMEKNSLTELGIQEGDVILEFNDFEYFKNKCKINDISVLLEDFERAVENSYGKEKEIVIASQKEGLYYIKKFTVPSSEHIDVYRTYYAKDVDEIYNTYMNYKNGN